MAICKLCDKEYSNKRAKLGYSTCLDCGEASAEQETRRKQRSVMPMHKSNSVYVSNPDDIIEISRMRRG